ncbi:ER membrane glycoprotein subunit of the GPI transamidase complex-like protein [Friedmanniomyces endolithicus]|uniref:GPI mannosyltransferase 2 n=1 Tax=Friedmanniomyces endolithicus TaxID=329885 RepID=A0A4U0UGB1_9PEZI|nr:ER membrane glycoprotein subunit of the GPI transamidase complex-like protein [Friedmanniomyces endolithicus]KAK0270458.1 ER membrane glycoprotein subunit of the GPI transamidase complex-like protein [Friedmanniomyces endolithicus]KAK0304678.1 ER membrane glycoprotein subunit of the GPI transamidase complex-like protein [Friedmanniomyces endolithicus]KAK0958236.1 ER membrane glycoprotein subunit of the GPI transamidase complex-like protein [Friedmanniomyces endolithicus]KAK0958535.1 ER membr
MDIIRTYLTTSRISQPASLRGKAVRHLELTSIRRLIPIFAAWKGLLLLIVLASPGPGYDTSTRILLDRQRGEHDSWFAFGLEYVLLRLTRWDGIYFASGSAHGQVYEQEWAFSPMLSRATSTVARVLFSPLPLPSIAKNALAGVLVSHLSHFLAVLVLYDLIHFVTPSTDLRKRQLAFTTACLHVVSPAGIFLSAPYGEATFAFLNLLGLLCYAHAIQNRFARFADAFQLDACWTLAAGICFGLATMIRTNGLLSGLIFAWDILTMLPRMQSILHTRDGEQITRFLATLTAGALVAIGFAAPQVFAYIGYCTNGNTRPWCSALPPSIYTFVQSHYWNVGFLRYWTLSNLPLFALALPVGWLMVASALPSILQTEDLNQAIAGPKQVDARSQPFPPPPQTSTREEKVFMHCLQRLALPQLVLVGLAATSFHVQIINRISSGYPVWYLMLAVQICVSGGWQEETGSEGRMGQRGSGVGEGDKSAGDGEEFVAGLFGLKKVKPEWVVRGMVTYAAVQAGLYASFLPPA